MLHDSNFQGGSEELINWTIFAEARGLLGEHFVRILGYFREDGMKSVAAIEEAMRNSDSAGLVVPSHTLKSEAAQFGADQLCAVAETIEVAARQYVEMRQDPSDLVAEAASLRPLFEKSLAALEAEASPLMQRRPASFGSGLSA